MFIAKVANQGASIRASLEAAPTPEKAETLLQNYFQKTVTQISPNLPSAKIKLNVVEQCLLSVKKGENEDVKEAMEKVQKAIIEVEGALKGEKP